MIYFKENINKDICDVSVEFIEKIQLWSRNINKMRIGSKFWRSNFVRYVSTQKYYILSFFNWLEAIVSITSINSLSEPTYFYGRSNRFRLEKKM